MAEVLHVELYGRTDETQSNTVGEVSRSRVFLVNTSSSDAARAHSHTPKPDDKHPLDSSLKCDSIGTQPNGNGSTIVTALYSNNNKFSRSTPTSIPETRESWGVSARDVIIEIPASVRTTIRIPAPPSIGLPNPPTTKRYWELTKIKLEETRLLRTLKVTFPLSSFAQLDYIATQNRVIHTIHGAKYQFLPDINSIKRITPLKYEARYTWELDTGTLYPPVYFVADKFWVVSDLPQNDPNRQVLRAPYAVLTAVPPVDPEISPFTAVNLFPYREVPDGWRLLPGIPPNF